MTRRIFVSILLTALAVLGAVLLGLAVLLSLLSPDARALLQMLHPYLPWVIAGGAALAVYMARLLSRRIVQPLKEDDFQTVGQYEELSPLMQRLESQQRQLEGQATELRRKQRQFDTVTRNMNEGLVLMNDQFRVLTINPAAARIMGMLRPYSGINFLTLDQAGALESLLHAALQGQQAEEDVPLSGGIYRIVASPVHAAGKVSGLALLMFDITQKHRSEALRREFTANVSHELKTPLQAISGSAELLKSGLVPPSDVPEFSQRIYTEAQRMVRLIEDILKLSRLDEQTAATEREPVELYAAAEEVLRELEPTAQRNQVTMSLSGSRDAVEAVPHLVTGIITNLCTNAIKYNRPGGQVRVQIRTAPEHVILTVADTGIGIAPEHQERIFERFYRVDKSHSKAVGGTGLGLSIVKHAAMILGARIELRSAPGQGTTMEVWFPKKS